MSKVRIKQVKSAIGRTKKQKLTIQALGLGKLHKVVEHEANPSILGMITKVQHLLEVEHL